MSTKQFSEAAVRLLSTLEEHAAVLQRDLNADLAEWRSRTAERLAERCAKLAEEPGELRDIAAACGELRNLALQEGLLADHDRRDLLQRIGTLAVSRIPAA